jgi:hypothetical protein
MVDHNLLADNIHEDNIKAGWWKRVSDPITGTETVPRNIGELLCLVHSEISEAYEGWKLQINDDHLPHHPMLSVELADAAIRIYDILGYYGKPVDIFALPHQFSGIVVPQALLEIHLRISNAMEGFRKGNEQKGCDYLCAALRHIIALAKREGIPLFEIIEEKREYNRNRLDHKPENRAQEGGKVF